MNYQQCLQYLDRLGNEVLTMKFGLDTIRTLLEALGNPHLKYPSVLIAGTNGKGSVARFLNSIFSACGVRNGLYTSPHLVKIEERFAIDNGFVGPETFAHYFTRVVEAIERIGFPAHPTYFDTVTATAFLYFSEQDIQIAFLEVGMGGRLDSTNIADPVLSIVTRIGLDHQKLLGDTLEAIAREKAGIMRAGRPVLSAPQRAPVRAVLCAEAAARKAHLLELQPSEIEGLSSNKGQYRYRFRGLDYPLGLYGKHQVENSALAIQASELLGKTFVLAAESMQEGIATTAWMGRLQKIGDKPAIFLDGAHNIDAAQNLAEFLIEHTQPPRSLVFAMMRDKDIARVLSILTPHFERVFFTTISSPRAATLEELTQFFPAGIAVPTPLDAVGLAKQSSSTVVITGSFYLVGEILRSPRC